MDLRKLRHAAALARHLNFTKAAEALNLTQSALSRSIQVLEEECQVRLFDRNRNMVAITSVGREFLRHAEVMLRGEAELASMVHNAARGDGGRISLGMVPLAARTLLAPLLSEMIDRPGFHANVTTGSPQRLIAMLLDETLELCVCTGQTLPANAPYASKLLARFTIGLVVRKDHPLAQLERVMPQDMDRFPILHTRSTDIGDSGTDSILALPRKQPAATVEDYDILMRITASSDAVWVTSPVAAREGIVSDTLTHLQIGWLEKPPVIGMTVHYLKHRTLSPLAEKVLERLVSLCGETDFSSGAGRT
jgi:DNA-binding transcriptional LysR family regulator